ncbi:hypothetical protein Q8F55_008700 [Vanrija albida]|uniref:Uncharacterized protein n=1 Tax=Vanrija albida TaxID=181172 RepID=A0ABR3PRU3_9TREE
MPVRPEDAEEYELPERRGSDAESDNGWDDDGFVTKPSAADDGGETSERDRLLEGDDERKPASADGEEDGLVFRRSADYEEEEIVGRGTKVDKLIAASVPSTDDVTLPTLTFRVIVIGSFFCILGAAASMVFYFKSNAPGFSSYFVILATYPLGHIMASERLIPRNKLLFGVNLNPGRFSVKEAILVSVLSSSGAMAAYAADILAILDLYYKRPLATIPSLVLLLTTQCIGFGLAGG